MDTKERISDLWYCVIFLICGLLIFLFGDASFGGILLSFGVIFSMIMVLIIWEADTKRS